MGGWGLKHCPRRPAHIPFATCLTSSLNIWAFSLFPQAIMRCPPTKSLTSREKDLIWRFRLVYASFPCCEPHLGDFQLSIFLCRLIMFRIFRPSYFLQRNKKALPFFLKCVNWKDAGEVKQAC